MSVAVDELPTRRLEVGTNLYRIHRIENGAWFFSGSGSGRFDPETPGRGACYFATDPLGSLIETFRTAMDIDERDVAGRALATIKLDRPLSIIDLTDRRALAAGVTVALSAGADYGPAHELATALQGKYDGVMWRLRHDLLQRLTGIALFGPEGAGDPANHPPAVDQEIDRLLIREAEDEFGYRVMPTP